MKWGWLIKMAWRDSKSSGKKLFLFTVSIVFGIAAFVAIQSFGESLKQNMALQSKALMGADYKIDTDQPPGEELLDVLDSLGGYEAREIAFPSMAAFSSTSQTKLVRVRGIEGAFPLYGQIESQPVNAADTYQKDFFALVDETVMLQFGLQIGDSIKLGYSQIVIGGALKSIPGSNAVFSSIAPPVVVPLDFLKQTRLIQTGSRIDYEFYFSAPPGIDLKNFDDVLDPRLDNIDADLDTHLSTSERLGRRYDNFGKFLNLVAFIALLLGCIGIASSVNIYIREKVSSVVILKCLGAENKQAFGIYLLQVAAIGGLSGLVGSLLGLGIQLAFPLLLEGLLPVDIVIQVHPHVVFSGLVLGFVIAILFSLHPLLKTFYVSPLEAIRVSEKKTDKPENSRIFTCGCCGGFCFFNVVVYFRPIAIRLELYGSFGSVFCFAGWGGQTFYKNIASVFPGGQKFCLPTKHQKFIPPSKPNPDIDCSYWFRELPRQHLVFYQRHVAATSTNRGQHTQTQPHHARFSDPTSR